MFLSLPEFTRSLAFCVKSLLPLYLLTGDYFCSYSLFLRVRLLWDSELSSLLLTAIFKPFFHLSWKKKKHLHFWGLGSVSVQSLSCIWPQRHRDPMDWITPGLPVHHQLLEFTQTHLHWVSDALQPSHPLSSPSPPAFNLSQHQGLFKWVSSLHQVAKVLEFQFQHQSFQGTPRTDFL